jgi:hypothetical protein
MCLEMVWQIWVHTGVLGRIPCQYWYVVQCGGFATFFGNIARYNAHRDSPAKEHKGEFCADDRINRVLAIACQRCSEIQIAYQASLVSDAGQASSRYVCRDCVLQRN